MSYILPYFFAYLKLLNELKNKKKNRIDFKFIIISGFGKS